MEALYLSELESFDDDGDEFFVFLLVFEGNAGAGDGPKQVPSLKHDEEVFPELGGPKELGEIGQGKISCIVVLDFTGRVFLFLGFPEVLKSSLFV